MKHYISLLLLIATALLPGSCSLVDGDPLPECPPDDARDFTLSFTVDASEMSRLSRADDQGHAEVDAEYLAFENTIDLSDIGIFVFAKMQNSAEEKLILKTVDIGKPTTSAPDFEVTGAGGVYTVRIFLGKDFFEEKVGQKMNPDNAEKVQFRILMISGATQPSGTGSLSLTRWNNIDGQTYADVIGQLDGTVADKNGAFYRWTYQMGNLCKHDGLNESGKQYLVNELYPNSRKHIPMFGTNTFTVSQYALVNSAPWREANLGDVDMLRSIAKIRVVDNITGKSGGYPKVTGVEFYGCQDALCVLPYDALGYQNGNQVHMPNVVVATHDVSQQQGVTYTPYLLGVTPPSWLSAPIQYKGDIFTGYVPEMNIVHDTPGIETPRFDITVALKENPDGTVETKVYKVSMLDEDKGINFGDYILRNHIYTLSVESVTLDNLTLRLAVNDWKTFDFEYEY